MDLEMQKKIPWKFGGLAQLGERLPCKQEVSGSIPLISTKEIDWSSFGRRDFIEFRRKFNYVPWKLNIESIMMQLWEGNIKGNF